MAEAKPKHEADDGQIDLEFTEEAQEVTLEEVADTEYHEVENITAVAGVRGAEAEDEALHHLYYRQSMKKLSKIDLQKALGKLIIKRKKMADDSDTEKIDSYILQLKRKLKKV